MVWVHNARILAVFAVVALHVAAGVVHSHGVGTVGWWIGNAYDSITRWCVAVFVMISGALLLDPRKNESLRTFYQKRASRILIPLLFWSAVYVALHAIDVASLGIRAFGMATFERLLAGEPHYHMWFLFMIVGLYLVTPFLRMITGSATGKELTFLIAAGFVLAAVSAVFAVHYPREITLFTDRFLAYIPYYLLGHVIQKRDWNPPKWLMLLIFGGSCFCTFAGYGYVSVMRSFSRARYFYGDLSLTVIPMSISIMLLLKQWQRPLIGARFAQLLATLTLGIYLVHPLAIKVVNVAGIGTAAYSPLVSIPVTSVIVLALSALASWVISRIPYLRRTI